VTPPLAFVVCVAEGTDECESILSGQAGVHLFEKGLHPDPAEPGVKGFKHNGQSGDHGGFLLAPNIMLKGKELSRQFFVYY
jgi:hypothetical protein